MTSKHQVLPRLQAAWFLELWSSTADYFSYTPGEFNLQVRNTGSQPTLLFYQDSDANPTVNISKDGSSTFEAGVNVRTQDAARGLTVNSSSDSQMEAIKVNANGGLQKILLGSTANTSFDGTCDVGTDGGVDFGARTKAASSVYQGAIFVQKPDGDNSSALAVYQGANTTATANISGDGTATFGDQAPWNDTANRYGTYISSLGQIGLYNPNSSSANSLIYGYGGGTQKFGITADGSADFRSFIRANPVPGVGTYAQLDGTDGLQIINSNVTQAQIDMNGAPTFAGTVKSKSWFDSERTDPSYYAFRAGYKVSDVYYESCRINADGSATFGKVTATAYDLESSPAAAMSNIRDTDILLVNRAGSSFQCSKANIDNVRDTDTFLVNRAGASYYVAKSDVSTNVRDSDLVLVNRGGVSYKGTGADLKAIVEPYDPDQYVPPTTWVAGNTLEGSWVDCAAGNGIVVAVSVKTTYGGNSYGGKGNRLLGGLNRLHSYNSVAFGKGKFVALRDRPNLEGGFAKVSTDGNVWTDSNVATGFDIATPDLYVNPKCLCFDEVTNKFYALVLDGTAGKYAVVLQMMALIGMPTTPTTSAQRME